MSRNHNSLPRQPLPKYGLLSINSSSSGNQQHKTPNNKIKSQQFNSNMSMLTKAQSQLQREIIAINVTLQRKYRNKSYKNGLIFKYEVDYSLANSIRHILDSHIEINSWGFIFDKDVTDEKEYKKERLLQKVLKVNRLGTESLKLPTRKRYNLTPQLQIDKWEYFSKGASLKYYKQRNKLRTQPTNRQLITSSYNQNYLQSVPYQQRQSYNQSSLKKRNSPRHQPQLQRQLLNPPQIYQILKKQQIIISLWQPHSPKSQLLGIMTFLVRQKQDGNQLCMIRKYWWMLKCITRVTFNSILDWLCAQLGYIDEITLLTSREYFDNVFAPMGWKLINWMQEQKIRISYKRILL